VKPWHERFPSIYEYEQNFWLNKGFKQASLHAGVDIAFTGTITARIKLNEELQAHGFKLRVIYPPGYPYVPPRVEFIDPKIKRARHQGLDGAPCLFPSSAWTLNFPASEFYIAIERWLGCHLAGSFPRELALYELPEYLSYSSFSILATPDLFEIARGKDSGGLSVDELLGHDLGVLWSLDERIIGRELLDALAPTKTRKVVRRIGRWYRLSEEPPAIQNTVELQKLLARHGHNVDLSNRPQLQRHLIGLVFPDAALEEERFLMLDLGAKSKKVTAEVAKGWRVRSPRSYVVSHEELFRRLDGVRDIAQLEDKRVVCFGLGAIGSPVALARTREGVGHFTLCDPDTLRSGNVIRHSLDLLSVGQFKAEAVESSLARINPSIDTVAETENLTHPDMIITRLRDADLVLLAIGDDLREELIGEIISTTEQPPPLILVRTLHAGDAFRVALVRPGVDACLRCLVDYQAEQHPDWIPVPAADLADVYDDGCASPARPGAGLTGQQAALFAAARALEVLEGRAGENDHWLWVERPVPDADARLQNPITLYQARFAPRAGCPVCGV
jgi:molybdopterin/thiamine biosynthesis adenylyltransferase